MRVRATCLLLLSLFLAGCSNLFGPAWEPVGLIDDAERLRVLGGSPPDQMSQRPDLKFPSHRWYRQVNETKPVVSGKRPQKLSSTKPPANGKATSSVGPLTRPSDAQQDAAVPIKVSTDPYLGFDTKKLSDKLDKLSAPEEAQK